MPKITPRNALGNALSNDPSGKVSADDAKKIKKSMVDAVLKSKEPQKTFNENMKVVDAAKDFIGVDKRTSEILNSTVDAGRNAIATRLGQLTGNAQLPLDVKETLADWLNGSLILEDGHALDVSKVKGNDRDGYSFRFKADDLETDAHALLYQGTWVVTPVKLTAAQLDSACKAAQGAYDEIRGYADPDGEYGFEDVAVEPRGADWEQYPDEIVLDFSHGAPEGGLYATYDKTNDSWSGWEEQM